MKRCFSHKPYLTVPPTNLGCSLCQESVPFESTALESTRLVDDLRTIKIYHIYIGQKIRLLD